MFLTQNFISTNQDGKLYARNSIQLNVVNLICQNNKIN